MRLSVVISGLLCLGFFPLDAKVVPGVLKGSKFITTVASDSLTLMVRSDSSKSTPKEDPLKPAAPDTFTPPMLGSSLRYGVDTTVSPCLDFYQYANGDWRAKTKLGKPPGQMKMVEIFGDTYRRTILRLQVILDSARSIAATTKDPTFRVLGTFYGSCLAADSLERTRMRRTRSQTPTQDSTRAEQCLQRTINTLGGALGQAFAKGLLGSNSIPRMQELLEALRVAAIDRIKVNPWMSPTEKTLALERLQKLHLRVGMPKEMTDYGPLVLSADYKQNKAAVANFDNQRWVNSIGGDLRAQWKTSLLTPNAFYRSGDHAIEIPAVMFMPPFFDVKAEDALNFAGIGLVIGHEIFHSIAGQLSSIENPEMKANIEKFQSLNSEFGTVDGWNTDGKRTFSEDVADLGGVLVSYAAWKATLKKNGKQAAPLVDGLIPDQRFFVGLAIVWRSKWGAGYNNDVHAAPFARVNAMVLNAPEFAKAFGCKDSDPMVRPTDKKVAIW